MADPSQRFDLAAELKAAPRNDQIGSDLMANDQDYRVWRIDLAPGERLPFHIHTRSYTWMCVSSGRGRVRSDDGSSVTKDFVAGESRLIGADELPAVHDLENVGETPLRFITVELLRGLRI